MEILEEMELQYSISYSSSYPLRLLFATDDLNNQRQKDYIVQGAHVDIIVYYTMDKQPLFGIEVDGAKHWKISSQRERDELKRSIFSYYNLPLLELPTHGSNEKEQIRSQLIMSIQKKDVETPVEHVPLPIVIMQGEDLKSWKESM
jgi:hypothetical protein